MDKKILFIDMDEVLCDFKNSHRLQDLENVRYNPPQMYARRFFSDLEPLEGALEAVQAIIQSELYVVHILTQPVARSPISYTEKAQWIAKWIPDLIDNIIMTQDKGLVLGDYLIDDNLRWKKPFENNGGKFIHFKKDQSSKKVWEKLLKELVYKPLKEKELEKEPISE